MNTFTAVMLSIIIHVGGDKPDIRHTEPMPDMETCLMEAGKLTRHQFPDLVGAEAMAVVCQGKIVTERPS